MKSKTHKTILVIAAFLVPVYFVFYPGLQDDKDKKFVKLLWKVTAAGTVVYLTIIALALLL